MTTRMIKSDKDLNRHLGRHMRELSLRSLPTHVAEPESDEEDLAGQNDRNDEQVDLDGSDSDLSTGTEESDIGLLPDGQIHI